MHLYFYNRVLYENVFADRNANVTVLRQVSDIDWGLKGQSSSGLKVVLYTKVVLTMKNIEVATLVSMKQSKNIKHHMWTSSFKNHNMLYIYKNCKKNI